MSEIMENLKAAFMESAYDFALQCQKDDPYYKQLEKEHTALFNNIQELLGDEHRKRMLDLEDLQNEKISIEDEFIYLKGMIDCVSLLRMIRLI